MKKILVSIFSVIIHINILCQQITMYFPKFAGKTYEFIVFNGRQQKVLYQGTIPADGKFYLNVPTDQSPYTGMSRWLITGTKEGGGIDVFIPGKNFSISCKDSLPDKNNIIYHNNEENNLINSLYDKQAMLFNSYTLMEKVLKVFPKTNKNYKTFSLEYKIQKQNFENFQSDLLLRDDFAGQLIQVINFTEGLLTMDKDSVKNARMIDDYIVKSLNWQYLYNSGYWLQLINLWVYLHVEILKDSNVFAQNIKNIKLKIESVAVFNDFIETIKGYLIRKGQQDFLSIL